MLGDAHSVRARTAAQAIRCRQTRRGQRDGAHLGLATGLATWRGRVATRLRARRSVGDDSLPLPDRRSGARMPFSVSPRRARSSTTRSPWRSLRHPSMRLWTAANVVSNAGTWMQLVAQNLLILQLTGSVVITGLSLSAQAAPGLLFGVLGGAVADRFPLRLVTAVGQVLLAVIAFATAALAVSGLLTAGHADILRETIDGQKSMS